MTNPPSTPSSQIARTNTAPKSGRRRSQQSHNAILNAALTLLEAKGYRAVTIEGIAAKAGVGKQTIYRWWPSKAAVVLEAFTRRAEGMITNPNSGDLQADLTLFLQQTFARLSAEYGPIVRGLMSEALLDPEFAADLRDMFIAKRRHVLLDILRRGVERGEVVANIDLELIVDMLYGPMWYRLLNRHAPLDNAFAEQLAYVIVKSLIVPDEYDIGNPKVTK